MLLKKNSNYSSNTATSQPNSPLSPRSFHLSPHLLPPSSSLTGSGSRSSKSKGRKISAGKLFQKAHETEQGQTYLKNLKGTKSYSPRHNGNVDQHNPKIMKTKSMAVSNELNIKVQGNQKENSHELSFIIDRFGTNGSSETWEEDLSSIKESCSQLLSDTGANQSLIRAMDSI